MAVFQINQNPAKGGNLFIMGDNPQIYEFMHTS